MLEKTSCGIIEQLNFEDYLRLQLIMAIKKAPLDLYINFWCKVFLRFNSSFWIL